VSLSFREALIAFRRSPLLSVLSVTTIAFSLFAFGLFGLVALNIRAALEQVEERVEIRAFAADRTSPERLALTAGEVARYPEVAEVELVTSDRALEKARRELGEFSDVFEGAILPASIEVKLRAGHRDPATVKRVADRLAALDFVDDVRFGEEWVGKLHRIRNIAGATGLVLGTAFALVALIIIGATIRMTVLARSREIAIMRLVGATDGFIRRPFLIEGFLKGVFGGAAALLLIWSATQVIERYLAFETVFFDGRLALAGLAAGAFMGLFGSMLSVRRHLGNV
jgi:cell division transport system permease protein